MSDDKIRYVLHIGGRSKNPGLALRVTRPDGQSFAVIRTTDPDDKRPELPLRDAVQRVLELGELSQEAEESEGDD